MKSSRGIDLAGAGGIAFLDDGCGDWMTGSCVGSVSAAGLADVIVVADVGAIGGVLTIDGVEDDDAGVCGVANTAIVTPKSIMPTTATTHVITARTLLRRGTSTVGRSCEFVSFRFARCEGGASADPAAASRPE